MADGDITAGDRTKSDLISGLSISQPHELERYDGTYTEDELAKHFETFKNYDLDDSGFISPDNLKQIMEALEIACSEEQLKNMIDEVAILAGHTTDGQLSFRDYIGCLEYEKDKDAVNAAIDATRERQESVEEAPPAEGEEPALEEEPQTRMRGSSFA